MNKLSVKNLDLKGKRIFLRVDFNVPLNENLQITDDTRIRAVLPTIGYLLNQDVRLIIASHLGRPKGKYKPELSLKPVQQKLSEILNQEVTLAPQVIGPEVERLKEDLKEKQILLLENLRFHPGETENDDQFARELAQGIDYYVNDAFGACHRAHASVVGITKFIQTCAAGFLVEKEIEYLGRALASPDRPFVAILGGAKVSDKIPVIENLLGKVDHLLIGGAMAYTFFKAKGKEVGKSLVEEDKIEIAKKIMAEAAEKKINFQLPVDSLVAERKESNVPVKIIKDEPFPESYIGLDIGPETIRQYSEIISQAKMIVWNGPMGVFEIEDFSRGTTAIARAVAESRAVSIVGGGDSVAAVYKAGVKNKITHISTGGGASLEFLAKGTLPGIEVLTEKI
ncbi:MAG: phosphoglycerate kinase [Candidatus Aminicenantia bacterium]